MRSGCRNRKKFTRVGDRVSGDPFCRRYRRSHRLRAARQRSRQSLARIGSENHLRRRRKIRIARTQCRLFESHVPESEVPGNLCLQFKSRRQNRSGPGSPKRRRRGDFIYVGNDGHTQRRHAHARKFNKRLLYRAAEFQAL